MKFLLAILLTGDCSAAVLSGYSILPTNASISASGGTGTIELAAPNALNLAVTTNSSRSGAVASNVGIALASTGGATNSTSQAQRAGVSVGYLAMSDNSYVVSQGGSAAVGSFEFAFGSSSEAFDGSYSGGQMDLSYDSHVQAMNGGFASGDLILSIGSDVMASSGLAIAHSRSANNAQVKAVRGSLAVGIADNNETLSATDGSFSIGQDVSSDIPFSWNLGRHFKADEPGLNIGYDGRKVFSVSTNGAIRTGGPGWILGGVTNGTLTINVAGTNLYIKFSLTP